MCGIAGIAGLSPIEAEPRVRTALARLRHRGPDGEGLKAWDSAVLGMRRLAIIDVECGAQPIFDESGRIGVVCNGEIYNYRELADELRARGHVFQSRSDVNVVPHLYEEVGRECVARCRGMFALALWNEQEHRLLLSRDRAGKKPLFWSRLREGVAFASELPALLALLDEIPPFDPAAIRDYLQLGSIPHPRTIYQSVFALPPASTLEFVPGRDIDIRQYWTLPEPATFTGSRESALEQIDGCLRESVALRLRSDVPLGMFLSGGIDSGLVASYAAESSAQDLLAFVVKVDDPVLDESAMALSVARRFGLPSEIVPLRVDALEVVQLLPTLYGQPFADSSAIPSYQVSKAAARHRKVVLNGDGGDELFAGYRRYAVAGLSARMRGVSAVARLGGRAMARLAPRRSTLGFGARVLRGLGQRDPDRYRTWTTDLLDAQALERCFPELGTNTLSDLETLRDEEISTAGLDAFLRSDFRYLLADDLLVKMDIATMAHGLEARSPFLDTALVELARSLPPHLLRSGRDTKPLLRSLASKRLPQGIAGAPKRGFEVPVEKWLRGPLQDIVESTLLSPHSRVATLGDRTAISSLVRREDGFSGNWAGVVWSLLVLELFLRSPITGTDS